MTGNADLNVTWIKNGTAVTADQRLNVSSAGAIFSLKITNLSRSDEGQYRCRAADNASEVDSNPGKLTVNCKYKKNSYIGSA